jgi:[CysO sulfur-carrier protein]-S-L-cysteine hydrolase
VLAHLEAVWPEEGCGFVLQAADGSFKVLPMRNVHPQPQAAFALELNEQLRVYTDAARSGARVACVFHSHPNAPAVFSALDRAAASSGDPPCLVVSVVGGRATGAALFWWEQGVLTSEELTLDGQIR